jgi:Tol biopolymer transport system component
MTRPIGRLALVASLLAGCTGGGTTASVAPGMSSGPTTSAASPSGPTSSVGTPAVMPANVPAGRILFHRRGSDEVERYFTINTDGTDEQALFTAEGCACARWSADGTRVWTMGSTGHGTWSFTTMRPDGSDRVVVSSPIETLNLGPGAPSVNGRFIAFDGWDETDPSRNGLYIASLDLANLHLVTPLPIGGTHVEPIAVTPDGSRILVFADSGDTPHPEGNLFIASVGGGGLRKLNPSGTTLNFLDVPAGGLSPDGRRAAFGVEGRIYVVDLDGGEALPITERADFVWAVSWSPTGEWITYSRKHESTSVVSLVRADGSDQKEISTNDGSDQAEVSVWSPDGKYLLVQRGAGGLNDLWIMDLEGRIIGQVTHEPSSYGTYSWAPTSGSDRGQPVRMQR